VGLVPAAAGALLVALMERDRSPEPSVTK
jgi:hypothetical protein